jgi:hypothetical protein
MTREELISICFKSIVPWTEWNNRDSYVAQLNVNQCYSLLCINADFNVNINNDTIEIVFINLNPEIIRESCFFNLEYDDYSLYKEAFPEEELFEYYNSVDIDDKQKYCYLPTLNRLEERNGSDWY